MALRTGYVVNELALFLPLLSESGMVSATVAFKMTRRDTYPAHTFGNHAFVGRSDHRTQQRKAWLPKAGEF
jgi:hypothetical protein